MAVDFVTHLISSLDYGVVTTLAAFVHQFVLPIIFTLVIASWLVFKEKKERMHSLAIAAVIGFLFYFSVKSLANVPRPCVELGGKITCPVDSSFPSGHTLAAAMAAIGMIASPLFYAFLVFVLFTAFSRIYLGVHTLADVSAGLALGLACFEIGQSVLGIQWLWKEREKEKNPKREFGRQAVHLLLGLGLALVCLVAQKPIAELVLICGIVAALVVMHMKINGQKLPLVDGIFHTFEREGVLPGSGTLWYLVGLLAIVSFAKSPAMGIGLVLIIGIGDGFSSIIGVNWGNHKLPWNPKKSLEGSAAFFVTALSSAIFISPLFAIALSFLGAVVESLPLKIDDNVSVSLVLIAGAAALGIL
ncbi:Undecaprenyl-diphosphatase [Candidatus Gugararchaeum adminiculabundum]|nr:Undecaprenyl-diphosphatase [Candidatus Gugararchaeum adminiculabundum]